eukprot:CAMPEP_0181201426 /NCGR_PEP_ID=MMETSP1096-20121128/18300_1 /TAXON_ID=156174 ORGANISM="Chrysochromulina ericina, Strain CCMP281" /NCGR_SAMPLE_ID=MMETSP1096 /ASSEMBLY_ACC=CAM_ASM_000453 /LENGTH=113 /DNA_ID=CAMNT_0023291867 /DNA_START=546 /DNA_END=885 /DNA_ORIENTATION=-
MHRDRDTEGKGDGHRVGVESPQAAARQQEAATVDASELECDDEEMRSRTEGEAASERDERRRRYAASLIASFSENDTTAARNVQPDAARLSRLPSMAGTVASGKGDTTGCTAN